MASKQLGKLRQWAGEVISTREKTQPSSEFIALEQDMEVRKKGLDTLYTASQDYLEYVSQKKQSEIVPGEPIAQSEALGVVMIGHGEGLGDASALGRSLATFGRARCRIVTMQNIYAVTLTDTFLAYLERSRAELDEYFAQRKKLESRRLALDAAIAKADKNYRKEKDKKEAEEELAKAKARYEVMAEDVRMRMDTIREGEVEHQRELKNFLGSEIKFVEQYLQVLKEVEEEWPEPDTYADLRGPASSFNDPHEFSRTSTRSTDSKDSDARNASSVSSRFSSHRSNRSVQSVNSKKSASASNRSTDIYETPSESEDVAAPRSRASSLHSRKASAKTSRAPSRSRISRKRSRSGSVTTIGNNTAVDTADETTSVKSNGKHKKAASGGVASWVGDAMSSVMSRNKSKNPDVENFASLGDDEGSKPIRSLSDRSTKSIRSANGRSRSRTRESAKRTRKVMKAVHDFSGSSEELSFKAGEEIVVVNEVLDDWWLGESGGKRGLFPANYTVFVKIVEVPSISQTKFKDPSTSNLNKLGLSLSRTKLSLEDKESRRTLVEPSESEFSMTEDEHDDVSIDESHPSDDVQKDNSPPAHIAIQSASKDSLTDGPQRSDSILSEDDFNRQLSSSLAKLSIQQVPSRPLSPGVTPSVHETQSPSPAKRMPPPPPPRRQTTVAVLSGPPPLPFRNVAPSRTHSSSAALHSLGPSVFDRRPYSETNSPFESQSELSFDAVATTKVTTATTVSCLSCGCADFVEDPFRGHGLCANCTHAHA